MALWSSLPVRKWVWSSSNETTGCSEMCVCVRLCMGWSSSCTACATVTFRVPRPMGKNAPMQSPGLMQVGPKRVPTCLWSIRNFPSAKCFKDFCLPPSVSLSLPLWVWTVESMISTCARLPSRMSILGTIIGLMAADLDAVKIRELTAF